MKGLHEAEENILSCLGSGHRLLYNLAATKKLASIRRLHDETLERYVIHDGLVLSLLSSLSSSLISSLSFTNYFCYRLQSNAVKRDWELHLTVPWKLSTNSTSSCCHVWCVTCYVNDQPNLSDIVVSVPCGVWCSYYSFWEVKCCVYIYIMITIDIITASVVLLTGLQ